MAALNITTELRPCAFQEVRWNEEKNEVDLITTKGLFHCWCHISRECRHPSGISTLTVALIEVEDGTIVEVLPKDITFTDNINLVSTHSDKNLKGLFMIIGTIIAILAGGLFISSAILEYLETVVSGLLVVSASVSLLF